ncbi:MAG: hypothetical protein JXB46_02115, partial [Candidatus Eisenbacteria bacterium]|nr:hypothetical protein [Candidatus Eisenbacteria bacterium]
APTLAEVTRPYLNKPWFVYQVQLGPVLDEGLTRALDGLRNGHTIHDPGGARLDDLRERIPIHAEPKTVTWTAETKMIALVIKRPKTDVSGELEVRYTPEDAPSSAMVLGVAREGVPSEVALTARMRPIKPGVASAVLTASAAGFVSSGEYRCSMSIGLADSCRGFRAQPLTVEARIRTAMTPPTWPYWVLGFVGVALLVAIVLLVRKRKLAQRLFGQFDYWKEGQPGKAGRSEELASFGSHTSMGSTGVIVPGETSVLATLSTRKVDSEQHVVVEPVAGKGLTHEGREVAELVLFDGDEFVLAGWHIRYRGATSRRRVRSAQS